MKRPRKKPEPKVIRLGLEVSSKLVGAAVELEQVKAALPKANSRIKAAETALATALSHKARLISQHKELQEQLRYESLLVKPE